MKEKPTVIAVVNQKGGTAKTTTVENLGIGLAREGKKVLLVDNDPQGSLTISLGYPRPDELEITLFDLLNKTINEDSVSAGEGVLHQAEGIDLIPANISLAGLEVALVNTMNRERILKQFLEPVKNNYDYVLLDCMPSLGMLTVNALAAVEKGGIVCQTGILGGVNALNGFDPIKDIPNGVYLTGFFSNYPPQQVIDEIFSFLNEKKLVPVSGKVFDFENIQEALTAQDEGTVNGKIVVKI